MLDEKQEKLTKMVEDFCDEYLNDEYKESSLELIDEMSDRKTVYFHSGKLEVWASAIIYAICQVNSLFDDSNEVHLTRKDIFKYFNTKQSIVSRKAMNLREIFDLDNEFSVSIHDSIDSRYGEYANIMDHHFGDDLGDITNNRTIKDYQRSINKYKRQLGEKFFKEHEGYFWAIPETRPFMQCLLEQAQLFWENGEREKAINQYKYMLKLNPNDNQGVRYSLISNLLELNRLDEVQELFLEFGDDSSANWVFSKLLFDIKNNASFEEIESQYKLCCDENPYVVPYLVGDKKLPFDMPPFYGVGDENEAIFYVSLSQGAWLSDKKAIDTLEKLSEK